MPLIILFRRRITAKIEGNIKFETPFADYCAPAGYTIHPLPRSVFRTDLVFIVPQLFSPDRLKAVQLIKFT